MVFRYYNNNVLSFSSSSMSPYYTFKLKLSILERVRGITTSISLSSSLLSQQQQSRKAHNIKHFLLFHHNNTLNKYHHHYNHHIRVLSSTTTLFFKSKESFCSLETTHDYLQNYYDPLYIYDSCNHRTDEKKQKKGVKRILICGDGDLSYGASLASGFATQEHDRQRRWNMSKSSNNTTVVKDNSCLEDNDEHYDVELIVSVLESEDVHNQVYKNSKQNIQTIQQYGHQVMFQVDATNLQSTFVQTNITTKFDRIQFNFPHWRGKQNNRHNRLLVQNFFISATKFIHPGGQIHMALLEHQGGMNATSINEWNKSWMVGRYAGESKLLLTNVLPFKPDYNLSSYQWRDRPFMLNDKSQMYIFTKPDDIITAGKDIQLYTYFSLFISLPSSDWTASSEQHNNDYWSKDEILDSGFIHDVVSHEIPHSIGCQVDLWRMHFKIVSDHNIEFSAAEYRVKLFGVMAPITLLDATKFKSIIENVVQAKTLGTRNGAWYPSKVIPAKIVNFFKE